MDKLPKGWENTALSSIVKVISGYAFPSSSFTKDGEFKAIKITNVGVQRFIESSEDDYLSLVNLEKYNSFKANENDIVVALTRSIINDGLKVAKVSKSFDNSYVNQRVACLKGNASTLKYIYLFLISEHAYKYVQEKSKSLNQPNLSINDLKSLVVPIPKETLEQTRIVKKLDSLFERIDKSITLLEENIKHTEALMASVLDEVFEQAENNKKFEIKLLKDAVRVINGRAYKQQELLNEGKYPVIRVGNFFSNRSWYYSDLELDEDKYCDNGDLLYAWSASFGPKIWDGDRSIFHYHIWKMEIISPNLLKDYLYYMLLRDTEKIKSEGGRGVGMIHITKGDIEVRKITLPPLVNQNQIVDKIKVLNQNLEKLLTEQQSKLNYLKALKASLLDKAFKGEL